MNIIDGSKLHEYQCKLYCLSLEAEYVVEKLLGYYSLQSNIAKKNGTTDPNEAFTAIVTHCHNNNNTLKNVKKLSYPDYKQKCFDLNTQVKTKIDIQELDITISYDFLRNLDIFPTCKERYKKQLKCKNLKAGGKHNHVCCNICMTCINCLPTSPCKSADIIVAVVFIKDVRNFTAHLKLPLCEKMEKGDFTCINITGCRTWNDLLIKYVDAIKTLLQYLSIILGIKIDSRCLNLEIIVNKNNEIYRPMYNSSLLNRIIQENFVILNYKDNIIKRTFDINLSFKKVEAVSFWGYLSSLYSSGDTPDIDEPFMKQVRTGYREAVQKIVFEELKLATNSGKYEIINIGFESLPPNQLELLSICMSIHIEFRNEPPECYTDTDSIESESLRNEIKSTVADVVRAVFELDIKVKCTKWRYSSLHISFDICKLDKHQWNDEERKMICSFLEQDERMLNEINTFLIGDIYSIDIGTSSDIPVPNTLTMEVDIEVHQEETLDQINNAWPTISSKLTNLPFDDVCSGKCFIETNSSNTVDCIVEDFVKFEEGKGFYKYYKHCLSEVVVMAQSNLYLK